MYAVKFCFLLLPIHFVSGEVYNANMKHGGIEIVGGRSGRIALSEPSSRRIFAGSHFAGIFLFFFVNVLLCPFIVARSYAQAAPSVKASTSPTTQASKNDFPLVGFTLKSVPQWRQLPSDRASRITQWISPQSQAGDVQGIIMIEMKKPAILDVRKVADSLAKASGGTVSDKQDILDGEVAWRIAAEPEADLHLVEELVCIHDGRLYLIEGEVTAGHSCHDEIELIRQGWKWIPLDPPVKHLEFRDQPAVLFNGKVSMNYPAAMNLFDDGHPESNVAIGLENYQLDRSEFTAFIQFGKLADGDTLASAEERVGKGIQAKFNLSEAFVWHAVNSPAMQGAVTQPVLGPEADGKNWIQWGIAVLPGNQVVLVNFTIYAEDPNDRATFAATAEKIIGSVSLSK
jgi:hypothetical protein